MDQIKFFEQRGGRALCRGKFHASEDHAGLTAARMAMFAGVPWQHRQFPLQCNAQDGFGRLDERTPAARHRVCMRTTNP